MEEYISGERHKELDTHTKQNLTKPILIVVVGILVIGASFYGGIAYQKSKQPKAATASFDTQGGPRGMRFSTAAGGSGGPRSIGATPIIGSVTAITDTSITVTDSDTNTATTLTIASTTSITDGNQQKIAASAIKVGDKVLVIANENDKTVADRIALNPQTMGSESGSSTTTAP